LNNSLTIIITLNKIRGIVGIDLDKLEELENVFVSLIKKRLHSKNHIE